VRFYALHDRQLERVVEWYTSLEAAQRELETILGDEPEWLDQLEIVSVDLASVAPAAKRPDTSSRVT
jgi:hypothetical protein